MRKTNERGLAVDALLSVTAGAAYNNLALQKALKQSATSEQESLTPAQRAFVTELVNGTLRNLIYLDYCIGAASKTPLEKIRPFILNTLRVSAYQLLFLDRVPPAAACNEAVELVKARGFEKLAGFVNGVLRSMARGVAPLPEDERKALAVRYSCPDWLITHLTDELGIDNTKRVLAASTTAPETTIGVNALRTNAAALTEILEAEGMRVRPSAFFDDALHVSKTSDLTQSAAFRNGLFHVLDESSMLAVRVLSPQPGETVLDACAAPGGKTLYAAYRMRDTGTIRACDIHEHKLALIQKSAARLGLGMVHAEQRDARISEPGLFGTVDRLLLDAPCSGLGLIRKKPDIKYRKTSGDIAALAALQREMLQSCAPYVKPGGVLVYSTCTISSAENLENIRWFTENFPFTPQDCTSLLPPGLDSDTAKAGTIQIIPDEKGMDGFFIARLVKDA